MSGICSMHGAVKSLYRILIGYLKRIDHREDSGCEYSKDVATLGLSSGTRPDVRVCVNVDAVKSASDDAQEPWFRVFELRGCTSQRGSLKRTAVRVFQGTRRTSSLCTGTVTASITSVSVSSMDTP
jgi:hypothetical protein